MNTANYRVDKHFWKTMGRAGFAFFMVKGMVWLVVPIVMYLIGFADR